MHVGIDVGADRIHAVAMGSPDQTIVDARVFEPNDPEIVTWAATAAAIAIDAPAMLSTAPHSSDEILGAKFRSGRCAEIALGREYRIWVPWATPTPDASIPSWMKVGLDLFASLRATTAPLIEVYPHAGFRVLAGKERLPSKSTVKGLLKRAQLLRDAGVSQQLLDMWSHDSLDAAVSALIAVRFSTGTAKRAGCGHDESAIWLP